MRLVLPVVSLAALAALHAAPAHVPARHVGVNGLRQLPELAKQSLRTSALAERGFGLDDAPDPGEVALWETLIYCALPKGKSVQKTIGGVTLTFEGWLGFAPEWADGPCETEQCQEWISACIGGKFNEWGLPVKVVFSPSEPTPADGAGGGGDGNDEYSVEDGAFYGNVFTGDQLLYACHGRGRDPLVNVFRRCAQHPDECQVIDAGECAQACEGLRDGTYTWAKCHAEQRGAGGRFPVGSHAFRDITVYVRPAQFCN
jgi:hypothetical protein